jgi:pimeloyl-ACP methyl ester carboxylesterase
LAETGRSLTRIKGFTDAELDYQLMRTLGTMASGGAALSEFLHAVAGVGDDDPDGWVKASGDLGRRLQAEAAGANVQGKLHTARDLYFRANQAWRNAEFWSVAPEAMSTVGLRASECFRRACEIWTELGGVSVTAAHVAWRDSGIPVTIFRPASAAPPKATLIVLNGSDGTGEEAWFWVGRAGLERGYAVVVADLPGQTGMLRTAPQSTFQPDMEVPVRALVQFLRERSEIPKAPVVILGFSFGGYVAVRSAARVEGVDGLIASPPLLDLGRTLGNLITRNGELQFDRDYAIDRLDEIPGMTRIFRRTVAIHCRKFGVRSVKALLAAIADYRITDQILREIRCPSLALVGEGEGEEFIAQARRFSQSVSGSAGLHRFSAISGGDAHCQVGNIGALASVAYDWIDSTIVAPAK